MNTKEATIKVLEDLTKEVRHGTMVACQGLAAADACHEVSEKSVVAIEELTKAVNSLSQSLGGFIDEIRGITQYHGDRLTQLEKRVPSADALQVRELVTAKEERL